MVFSVYSFASVSTALLLQYGHAAGRLTPITAGRVGIHSSSCEFVGMVLRGRANVRAYGRYRVVRGTA